VRKKVIDEAVTTINGLMQDYRSAVRGWMLRAAINSGEKIGEYCSPELLANLPVEVISGLATLPDFVGFTRLLEENGQEPPSFNPETIIAAALQEADRRGLVLHNKRYISRDEMDCLVATQRAEAEAKRVAEQQRALKTERTDRVILLVIAFIVAIVAFFFFWVVTTFPP